MIYLIEFRIWCTIQSCTSVCGNIAFIASGKPLRPSTEAISISSTPLACKSVRTESQKLWGIKIDEAFFLGGSEKAEVLEAFGADIFFDDQDVHLKTSSKVVPSAKVIHESIKEKEKQT